MAVTTGGSGGLFSLTEVKDSCGGKSHGNGFGKSDSDGLDEITETGGLEQETG